MGRAQLVNKQGATIYFIEVWNSLLGGGGGAVRFFIHQKKKDDTYFPKHILTLPKIRKYWKDIQ